MSTSSLPRTLGDGLSLAFREWNAGAESIPLVLLHGVTGSSADWIATARNLGERRIIALDARGHGQSDWDPGEGYGGDQHFADLVSALDTLELERCILAGFSMGGGVAMITAAALPDRVAGVVVADTYPDPRMTPGSRRIAGWIAACQGSAGWFDPAIARQFNTRLAAGEEDRLDLWPMWESISCPALIVRGAHSDVLPGPVANEMVTRQPRAMLETIPGVAHGLPYLRPRELAGSIAAFATTVEAPPAGTGGRVRQEIVG